MANKSIITIILAISLNLFSSNALASCINKNDSNETNYSRCYKEALEFSNNSKSWTISNKSAVLLEKSARAGNSIAQYYYGMLYMPVRRGNLFDPNDGKAKSWFKKSAKQGDARAQYELGMLYLTGNSQHDKSMPRNVFMGTKGTFSEKADELLKKSAAQGYEPAKEALAEADKNVVAVQEKHKTDLQNKQNAEMLKANKASIEEKKLTAVSNASFANDKLLSTDYHALICRNETEELYNYGRDKYVSKRHALVAYAEGSGVIKVNGLPPIQLTLTDKSNKMFKYTPVDSYDKKYVTIEVLRNGTAITKIEKYPGNTIETIFNLDCEVLDKTIAYNKVGKKSPEEIKAAKIAEKKATKQAEKVCYSNEGDQKQRFNACLTLARKGDTKSQQIVALAYANGAIDGDKSAVNQDFKKSQYWYEQLAKKGIAGAEKQLVIVNGLVEEQKSLDDMRKRMEKEATEKEKRGKLANTWFKTVASDWFRKNGVHPDPVNLRCEKDKSPADFSESMSMFSSSVRFEDEIEHNNKIVETTVAFRNPLQGNARIAFRFFRGLDRCEAYVANEKQLWKDVKTAKNKALDKYR